VSNVTFSGRDLIAVHHPEMSTAGTVLFNMEDSYPMGIAFDYPVRAFGADFGSGSGAQFASFTATLTLDSGHTFTFTSPTNPDSTFFGFIVDKPILSMAFSDGGKFYSAGWYFHGETIKDIYMVSEIPEPRALALAELGAVIFALTTIRKNGLSSRANHATALDAENAPGHAVVSGPGQ
jgi:hypothetical protein